MSKPPDYEDGAVKIGTMHSPIVDPSSLSPVEQAALMAKGVCGQCRHWDYAQGQAEMTAGRFMEQLVKEHQWQAHHLAAPANHMGFCGMHNSGARGESRTLTAKMNPACEAFQEKRGLVSLHRKGEY